MANLIELAKSYVPMLDEVYKLASLYVRHGRRAGRSSRARR